MKDLDSQKDNMDSSDDFTYIPNMRGLIRPKTVDRPSGIKNWKFCPHCGKEL